MKKFITNDKLIKSIHKHKNILKNYYEVNFNQLFFNDMHYKNNYFVSLIHGKNREYDWNVLKKATPLFENIFNENDNIIIPSISIGRMEPNKDWFISHKHTMKTDYRVYHYILKCNDNCGMIIENEYLKYEEGMIFGFNANKRHIAFNFGDSIKDSFIFIILNKKYTLKDWFDEKIEYAIANQYGVYEMNKERARKKIKQLTGF